MNLLFLLRAALLSSACCAFASLPATAQDDAPLRLAVVDLEAVVSGSAAGLALQAEMEAFRQSVQAEMDRRQLEAGSLRERIAEGGAALPAEQLAGLQQQLDAAMAEIQRYASDQQREIEKLRNRKLGEIERGLQPVFEQIQAESAYDVIFNKTPGIVVMAGERVDITQEVIRRFDAATETR